MSNSVPYSIAELLDARNTALYQEVSSRAKVTLEASEDRYWGEKYSSGNVVIYCSTPAHPISCFTHELLHGKFDLDGMAKPDFLVKTTPAEFKELNDRAKGLLNYSYNQLIHAKMFPVFLKLGFPASEFLHDSDVQGGGPNDANPAENVEELKKLRKKTKAHIPVRISIYPYLFFSSPHAPAESSRRKLNELRRLSGSEIHKVDRLLEHLQRDEKPDMRVYLARLFNLCGLIDVGFGYDDKNLIWSSAYGEDLK